MESIVTDLVLQHVREEFPDHFPVDKDGATKYAIEWTYHHQGAVDDTHTWVGDSIYNCPGDAEKAWAAMESLDHLPNYTHRIITYIRAEF